MTARIFISTAEVAGLLGVVEGCERRRRLLLQRRDLRRHHERQEDAADRAADFLFHPDQTLEPQDDGSLIVRFCAAGWLEMAWHLYQWGDKVEVLAPEGLRTMIDGHRRNDFSALP